MSKNKINQLYKAAYPTLRKIDNSICIEITESSKRGKYECVTYYPHYYEDNGEYVKSVDFIFCASNIRDMKNKLKYGYYLNEEC